MSTRTLLQNGSAVILLAGLAACGASAEVQRELEQLAALSAEKDSLLVQVTENARLMSEISAELARVQAAPASGAQEGPLEVTRENLLANIHHLTTRVIESETRLAESERRIEELTRESGTQRTRLGELQRMVRDFQATIENQKQTIASLTEQVQNLEAENIRLSAENIMLGEERTALTEAVHELTERDNTVYYVVGTKDELIRRGIVTEEGGSRVLFVFGKRGKTLVPARELDTSEFIALDKRYVTEIALPLANKDYRIVSRQDLSSLETLPDKDGEIRGALRIADPERFWANNRFLIIVQS